jgi:hypothetical protein
MSAVVSRPILLACSFAAALNALPAWADQSDDLNRLREEAAKQRRDLEETEGHIRALEQQRGDAPVRAATPGPRVSELVQLKKNWSQVEPGAPQERVHTLLGAPEKVLRIDGALVWYYAYPGIGPGSVFFNASGKVSSRQSPYLGW